MTHRRITLLGLILTVALLGAACGDDSSPVEAGAPTTPTGPAPTATPPTTLDPSTPAGKLANARATWAAVGPPTYRITVRALCFCMASVWTDTVEDGVVTAHVAQVADAFDPGPRTMEDLFDEVEAAISEGYATLDLEFDSETGALIRYWVDVNEMVADEEHGVEVAFSTDVTPPPENGVDTAHLTEVYGCGWGFALGSESGDLALMIHTTEAEPDTTRPVTLPDSAWSAEITTGSDLFANWCNDVVDPTQPQPRVDARWTLTAGTLTFTDRIDTPRSCDGVDVHATLTGAVAESTDGQTVELEPIDLRNPGWGCFAG
ncbi:MAG: DUF6174 domain-containing protein [Acidimicrobiales bacterium]